MNAAIEFKDFLLEKPRVICAYTQDVLYYINSIEPARISLPLGYTETQWYEFLNELDFNYDNSYGSQKLGGVIWFEDGTWADRGEYDGSEWWNYHKCPQVPTFLYPFETQY